MTIRGFAVGRFAHEGTAVWVDYLGRIARDPLPDDAILLVDGECVGCDFRAAAASAAAVVCSMSDAAHAAIIARELGTLRAVRMLPPWKYRPTDGYAQGYDFPTFKDLDGKRVRLTSSGDAARLDVIG